MSYLIGKSCICGIGALAAALSSAPAFSATNFIQTNLIADTSGAAAVTDPNLVGAWGISESASGPFWVSDAGNGTSTFYTVSSAAPATLTAPTVSSTVVTVPPSVNNKSRKTGIPTVQVNNGYGLGNFDVTPAGSGLANIGSTFIFATLDGTIAARNGSTSMIEVDNGAKRAVYS